VLVSCTALHQSCKTVLSDAGSAQPYCCKSIKQIGAELCSAVPTHGICMPDSFLSSQLVEETAGGSNIASSGGSATAEHYASPHLLRGSSLRS
jgi:hypothetical protein